MTISSVDAAPDARGLRSSADDRLIAVLVAAQREAKSEGEALVSLIQAAGDGSVGRSISYYA